MKSDLGQRSLAILLPPFIFATICYGGPAAPTCIDYEEYIHWVGVVDTPGFAQQIAVSGQHAYVADRASGLQVIDISDPRHMQIVGSVDTPSSAYDVIVSGHHAYVADDAAGLLVIDIENPTSPNIVGGVDTPGAARAVALLGTLAIVADGTAGIQLIDVAVPANPQIVNVVDTPDTARDVACSGSFAYVADSGSGLQVIDLSDPGNAHIVGTLNASPSYKAVAVAGSRLCVGTSYRGSHGEGLGSLHIIDITIPQDPKRLGLLLLDSPCFSVSMSGPHAYVAELGSSLMVIDIADPQNPEVIGRAATPYQAWGVAVSGNEAYVADGTSGLHAIDISNPSNPPFVVAGAEQGIYVPMAVAVQETFAYVCTHEQYGGELIIVDASNDVPSRRGSVFLGLTFEVAALGDYAYVTNGWALKAIDVTDPDNPQIVGSVMTPGGGYGVALSEDYAYVADFYFGLQIVDITNPATVHVVGGVDTPGVARGVEISGSFAYVADEDGLQVIDVSDPQSPFIVGALTTIPAMDLAIAGPYAYVAGGYFSDLAVVEVSNPQDPRVVASVNTAVSPFSVAVSGAQAIVADDEGGVALIDVANPEAPRLLGAVVAAGGTAVRQVATSGERFFAADVGAGLLILPFQCASSTAASSSILRTPASLLTFPNPTSSRVTIRFSSASSEVVRTSIYDVSGRLVRTLHDGVLDAGMHEFGWDGLDAGGRKVAAGIYLVRATSPAGAASERITLVR